jgi:hypothetical protein
MALKLLAVVQKHGLEALVYCGVAIPERLARFATKPEEAEIMSQGYACCFCGEGIDPLPPDVVSRLYTSCADQRSNRLKRTQELYCHTKCFQVQLHNVPLYVLDVLGDDPDDKLDEE